MTILVNQRQVVDIECLTSAKGLTKSYEIPGEKVILSTLQDFILFCFSLKSPSCPFGCHAFGIIAVNNAVFLIYSL